MFIMLCRKDRWCSDTTNLSATRTELGIAIWPAQLSAAVSWHQVHSNPSWHMIKSSEMRWKAQAALRMLLATSPAFQDGPSWMLCCRLGGTGDKGVTLEGPLGALMRRAAYWYRQPTSEHRLEVGTSWLQQAVEETSRAFQGTRTA